MVTSKFKLPELPLEKWEETKTTLHLFAQIMGKIRMGLMPRSNHWWNITLYVCPKGLTTHSIPFPDGDGSFELTLNFSRSQFEFISSRGVFQRFQLGEGLSVADFYNKTMEILRKNKITVPMVPYPYDVPLKFPERKKFAEIHEYSAWQSDYVDSYWKILMWVDRIFREFSGRFYGKTCPVHLYWHHFDLAVTRFSGKRFHEFPEGMSIQDKDAYSHEVISFGFWPGDVNVRGAAFYSYTYPAPEGLNREPLSPEKAQWGDNNGSPMAMLMYDDLKNAGNPDRALMDFLESAYLAGAKRAGWDIEEFMVPDLKDL